MEGFDIGTRLRQAHFLGQMFHETAGMRTLEEYASGDAYEYRRDLGNIEKGDGRKFKGRGLFQITGRAKYRQYGKALRVDLENDPGLAASPEIAARTAALSWVIFGLNQAADRDDLIAVTRLLHGSLNGLENRRLQTDRAKQTLAESNTEVCRR